MGYNRWELRQGKAKIISSGFTACDKIEILLVSLGALLGGIVSQVYSPEYTKITFMEDTELILYVNTRYMEESNKE